MSYIVINGQRFESSPGGRIDIIGGKLMVDGVEKAPIGGGGVTIETNNQPTSIFCDQNVTVKGDVTHGVKAKGYVECGSVTGGIETSGNIDCGSVVGNIKAEEVNCGSVIGNIKAESVKRG